MRKRLSTTCKMDIRPAAPKSLDKSQKLWYSLKSKCSSIEYFSKERKGFSMYPHFNTPTVSVSQEPRPAVARRAA
jgi:hypothetical protein